MLHGDHRVTVCTCLLRASSLIVPRGTRCLRLLRQPTASHRTVLGLRRRMRSRFTRPSSSSRRGASRIPSWPPIPARRSGCGAARPAGSRSRGACRRCRVISSGCTTSAGRPTGSRRSSSRPTRIDLPAHSRRRSATACRDAAHAARRRLPRRPFPPAGAAGGWRAEGTEINERTAAHAAARTGVPSIGLSAERLPESAASYDAVTLTDVLEHIPEPVTLLSTVRRAGRRRRMGRGQGAVRSRAAAEGDLARAPQRGLSGHARRQPRAHQPLFARALRRALERAGFDDITVEIAAPECPPGARGVVAASGSRSTTSAGAARRRPHAARAAPPGVRTRRSGVARRATIMTDSRPAPVGRHPDLQQRGGAPALPRQLAASAGRVRRRDHRHRGRLPRRHARVSRVREPVGVGSAAPALDPHGRCPRAALHERRAVGGARAADDGLAGRHVRHRATGSSPSCSRHSASIADIGMMSLSRGLDHYPLDEPIARWEDLVDWRRLRSTIGPAPGNWFRLQEVDAVIRPWIVRARVHRARRRCSTKRSCRPSGTRRISAYRIREAGWKIGDLRLRAAWRLRAPGQQHARRAERRRTRRAC